MKAIASLGLALTLAAAPALTAQDPLVRQEQKQEGIRDATARASDQLAQLVAEFDRNGIVGQDVDVLKAIQSVLGRLSTDQMRKIVELLQGARDGDAQSQKVVGAFTNQKAVIVQLRQVLLEYQRQLALHQIARLLRELGDRQSGNLHENLALIATGRDKSAFRDADKLSIQMQEAEQIAVRDETGGILVRLEALAGTTAAGLDTRAAEGMRFAVGRRLRESLDAAVDDLGDQRLMSAASNEKSARDTLWELAAMLEAEKDATEALLEAVAELDALIAGEKDVIKTTEQLGKDPRVEGANALEQDRGVRKAREELARNEDRLRETEAREETRSAEAMERLVAEVAKSAERIEEARDSEKKDENQIREREQQLAKAEENLGRRAKEIEEKRAERARSREEQVARKQSDIDKALEQARVRQGVVTPEEARERLAMQAQKEQAELVDKADFLQSRIESLAAESSARLGESIVDMQEAREILARDTAPENKIEPALAEERAALAHLEAAREALLEQLDNANLVEAVPDTKLEALEELLDKVRDLKHEEEALMQTAEKAESRNDPDALTAQAAPQADLENQTRQAQQAAAELVPEAASDLAEAAEMMDVSSEALESGENAPEAQQAAVDALAQAEQKIEDQIGDLQAAQAELAELNDLLDKLNPIIEKQQDLQSDTHRESAKPDPDASANQELAGQQDSLREETSALAQEVAESSVPQAAENLSDAAQNEQAAKDDLAQNMPDEAQPDQSQALENLNAAKGALEERMQELAQALGESPQPAADFAAAQAAIAMAQEQVAEAMSQLESPASLAEQLAERQEALAENIAAQAQAQGQPQNTESSPLAQAEAAAAQAAGELAQGDVQAAIGEMQKAQDALGQSQAQGQPQSPAGEAAPSVPELAREQAAVQSLAEQLANANTAAATEPLANASVAISPFSSESQGALPPSAQAALQSAQGALAEAGAEAAANSPQPAQANAEAAQNALADAAAALALAEAGLGAPSLASAQSPSKGQGQTPGQSPGQTPGQGQQPGQTPSPPSPTPSDGNLGNWTGTGAENGERRAATGTSGFIGLPKRERGTIRQSSSDSYPAEYGAQIEQYLKNLADQASGK